MPTQVQIRGAAKATQEARTLAVRELDINVTDKRVCVHDGLTAGGMPHVNYKDHQNQEFTYGLATGINAMEVTLPKAPDGYYAGQKFTVRAENTITGAATININGLGALTLRKKDRNAGTIVNADSGDIIGGGVYTIHVLGATQALIESVDGAGLTSISQGDLNTSSGTGTIGSSTNSAILIAFSCTASYVANIGTIRHSGSNPAPQTNTMPGGQYGFYPRTRISGVNYQFAQQYVTSSPPFDLGDGEAAGFIFGLVNPLGEITQSYIADVPPWAYNGPTDICACAKCPITGKKYRRAKKKMMLEEILDGAPVEFVMEEITHELKNKDMGIIPHPFGTVPAGHHVVLLDPMSDIVRRLVDYQNAGGDDVADALSMGKIYTEDAPLNRCGPQGVMITPIRFK